MLLVMKRVNIAEAKAKLPKQGQRPMGLAKGLMPLPDDFNDPDPALEAELYGDSKDDPSVTQAGNDCFSRDSI